MSPPPCAMPGRSVAVRDAARQATRIRFAESSHLTTTGSPGPIPTTAAAPVAFWRRATISPATSVVIRNSVWSPRYVPWLTRPSMVVQPAPAGSDVADRVDAEALGPHRDHDLRAGRRPGVGIRHHPREAESRCGLDDAAPRCRIVLEEPARDRVRDADEVGHEAVDRSLVELGRLALLLDPPVVHDDDDVRHRQRLLLVVGHVHERDPDLLLERLELELHLLAQLEVERAERLVEEEDGRVVDERPGERDTLLLAAGQLPGAAGAVARQPHELERLAHAMRLVVLADALLPQPVADVLGDGHVREQGVVLEHRVDVTAVRRDARDRLPGEVDLARGRLLEAGDHAQRRRLPAAGRAEERVERAASDLEVHGVDGGDVAEALGDVADVHVRDVGARGVRRRVVAQALGRDRRAGDVVVVVMIPRGGIRRRRRGQAGILGSWQQGVTQPLRFADRT